MFATETEDSQKLFHEVKELEEKIRNALNIKISEPDFIEIIQAIGTKLNYIKCTIVYLNIFNDFQFFELIIVILTNVYKLCNRYEEYENKDANCTSELQVSFKICHELQTKVLEYLDKSKSDYFDDNRIYILRLCFLLSRLGSVGEKISIKLTTPVWKCLKNISSTYTGLIVEQMNDKVLGDIISHYNTAILFRLQRWFNSIYSADSMNELKRCSCLLRLLSGFITTYNREILVCCDKKMCHAFTQVVLLSQHISEYKKKLISTENCDESLRQFSDNIFSGISIIFHTIIECGHEDIPLVIIDRFQETKPDLSTDMFLFSALLDCLISKSSETKSYWLRLGLLELILKMIEKLSENSSNEQFRYLYKSVLIGSCCLLVTQPQEDVQTAERVLLCSLTNQNTSLCVWMFVCDVFVFYCRYGPLTVTKDHCTLLCELILMSSECESGEERRGGGGCGMESWRLGFVLTRLLKTLRESDRKNVLLKFQDIRVWCYYPWKQQNMRSGDDDIDGVTLSDMTSQILSRGINSLLVSFTTEQGGHAWWIYINNLLFCIVHFVEMYLEELDSRIIKQHILPIVSMVIKLNEEEGCRDVVIKQVFHQFYQKYEEQESEVPFELNGVFKEEEDVDIIKCDEEIIDILKEIDKKCVQLNQTLLNHPKPLPDNITSHIQTIISTLTTTSNNS